MTGDSTISKAKFIEISSLLESKVLDLMRCRQTLHVGSNLSCIDIITAFHVFVGEGDSATLMLGKGQAAAAYWVAHYYFNDVLESDPSDAYTILGRGMSPAMGSYKVQPGSLPVAALGNSLGMAAGRAASNPNKEIFLLLGDGELEQGPIWESLLLICSQNLKNLTIIVDCNSYKAGTTTLLSLNQMKKIALVLGFSCSILDGHSYRDLKKYLSVKSSGPRILLAKTKFAKNMPSAEMSNKSRYKPLDELC